MRTVGVLFAATALAATPVVAEDGDTSVLRRYGVAPTRDGIARYFASFHVDKKERERIDAMVRALADRHPARREHATNFLRDKGVGTIAALRPGLSSTDPDVRRHARALYQRARKMQEEATLAALRLIAHKKFPGLAASLLSIAPACDDRDELRRVLERALLATAAERDIGHVRKVVAEDEPARLAFSLLVLAHLAGKEAGAEILPRLTDPRPRVAVAAARAAANIRDPLCLPALVELLASEDRRTRRTAAHVLRRITGRRFGYASFDSDKSRQAATARWRRFLAEHDLSPSWKTPVDLGRPFLGRTLVVMYQQHKVVELDPRGRTVWSKKNLPGAWSVAGSPEGFRAVGLVGGARHVVMFDPSGNEVWRTRNLPGFAVHLSFTDRGHLLVCCSGNARKVVELDPRGRTVWQYAIDRRQTPNAALRLPNGNTLIATSHRVFELRPNGTTAWQTVAYKSVAGLTRRDNGRIVLFETRKRRVVELDSRGREVRTYPLPRGPQYFGQALPNGRFLLSSQNRVFETDRTGRVFWEHRGAGALKAVRY